MAASGHGGGGAGESECEQINRSDCGIEKALFRVDLEMVCQVLS